MSLSSVAPSTDPASVSIPGGQPLTFNVRAQMPECLDKFGRLVSVGSRVRIIELSPQFLKSLPPDEIDDVRSMIGEVFEVYEIDDYGSAWVGKGWSHPETGHYLGHSLGLEPHEMELVNAI